MKGLLSAISFLTILPLPKTISLKEDDFQRATKYFPLVGLLLGIALCQLDLLLLRLFSVQITSHFIILTLWAASGALHADGLADTADGFLSSRPREKILEIMKDPRSGPMAVLVLIGVYSLKVNALSELTGNYRTIIIALLPVWGRLSLHFGICFSNYARDKGLASSFIHQRPYLPLLASLLFLSLFFVREMGILGLGFTLTFALTNILFTLYSKKKIGGFTGDTLGAGLEFTECAILLAATVITRGTL